MSYIYIYIVYVMVYYIYLCFGLFCILWDIILIYIYIYFFGTWFKFVYFVAYDLWHAPIYYTFCGIFSYIYIYIYIYTYYIYCGIRHYILNISWHVFHILCNLWYRLYILSLLYVCILWYSFYIMYILWYIFICYGIYVYIYIYIYIYIISSFYGYFVFCGILF